MKRSLWAKNFHVQRVEKRKSQVTFLGFYRKTIFNNKIVVEQLKVIVENI